MDRPPFENDDVAERDASIVRMRPRSLGEDAALAFSAFLEAIALPAWLHDTDSGEIIAVNDALVDLTRRPRATLVGSRTGDLFSSDATITAARDAEKGPARPHEEAIARLAVRPSGSMTVKLSSRPAPAVRPAAQLTVAHEIAAIDPAPPPVTGSDARWRMFVEMSPLPAAISRLDPETHRTVEFLVVNDALFDATGFSRDELMRMRPLDLIHPDDRGDVIRDIERGFGGVRPAAFDAQARRHRRKDGSHVDVHMASVTIPFQGEQARLTVLTDVTARRRSEAASAQSEQRYRTLFEVCPVAACVYDLTTLQFVAVNDAMIKLYGYSRDQLLQMGVLDLVAPDDADLVIGQIEELRRGGNAHVLFRAHTVRHRLHGGEEIDVELIEAPLVYAGSKAQLVMHQDVTEHKRAQADLVRRARIDAFRADLGAAMMADEPLPAHFERVTEAMIGHLDLDSVGVWVLEEATGQLALQASAGGLDVATAGGSRLRFGETWIGRAALRGSPLLLETMDPGMRPLEVTHAQQHGISCVAAFPIVARARVIGVVTAGCSNTIPDEVVAILRSTAAQIAQVAGAAFAYEALRISESLSRSILANMLSALVTISDEGVVETANPAAIAAFGFTRDELLGRPFASLFDIGPKEAKSFVTRTRGRVVEVRGRKKSGDTFPCEVRLFHLESLRGPGYAAILHDLSERYEVERLKAEFVSIVSHELRTPLTALRGSIGLLTGGVMGALADDVMELLQIAERNTKRLIDLVNDILDLERLQHKKLDLFIQPVRALTIVDRSIESVKSFADQERIRLEVRCTDDVVLGDGDRLVQVLVNLLSNAVKFSAPGSRVEVSDVVEAATVQFRVTDHGRGIPASHQRVIFERFAQVHSADAREKGGTGLGLPIAKAIVEQHDGTIGVESEEGAGSTFWFRIPRAIQ